MGVQHAHWPTRHYPSLCAPSLRMKRSVHCYNVIMYMSGQYDHCVNSFVGLSSLNYFCNITDSSCRGRQINLWIYCKCSYLFKLLDTYTFLIIRYCYYYVLLVYLFIYFQVYNIISPEQEKDGNARSRYNGRLFLSWLQDVDDKWDKIKVWNCFLIIMYDFFCSLAACFRYCCILFNIQV